MPRRDGEWVPDSEKPGTGVMVSKVDSLKLMFDIEDEPPDSRPLPFDPRDMPTPPKDLEWVSKMDPESVDLINLVKQQRDPWLDILKNPAVKGTPMYDDYKMKVADMDKYIAALENVAGLPRSTDGTSVIDGGWKRNVREMADDMPHISALRRRYKELARDFSMYKGLPNGTGDNLAEIIEAAGGVFKIADELEFCRAHDLPGMQDSKDKLLEILDEVCASPGQWNKVKDATTMMCAYLISYTIPVFKSPPEVPKKIMVTDTTRLKEMTATVNKHVARLSQGLADLEVDMRRDGRWQKLARIEGPSNTILRQDDSTLLGNLKDFKTNQECFCREPIRPEHSPAMYHVTENIIKCLDQDLVDHLRHESNTMVKSYSKVQKEYLPDYLKCVDLKTIAYSQPFLMWLLNCARKVNDSFQQKVYELVGRHRFDGDPKDVKIKKIGRASFKIKNDYAECKMPSGAHLLDVVRCLVSCPTVDDLVRTYEMIRKTFFILRVKNGFAIESEDGSLFRQVLINVKYKDTKTGISMICEIQLNLAQWCDVKHQIHRFYTMARCTDPAEVYQTIISKVYPF